jgi:hypothetical protein
MILYYTKKYHNAFVRFLHDFFIQTPLIVWFRFLAPVLTFWQNGTFINYTPLTYVQLMGIWSTAQQGLATQQIPISTNGTNLHPPDPRALTVQPENVSVISMPDWSIADLEKIDPAWSKDKDPSGSFAVDTGFEYETVAGITMPWKRPRIYGAASVLATVLVWEFQNVILSKLGYDVSTR